MDVERPGYYAIIPADVRYDDEIPPNAKLLYGEISALIGADGYCFASNQYFSQIYKMSVETISRLISKLEKAGYIHREVVKDGSGQIISRKIFLSTSLPRIQKHDSGVNTSPAEADGGIDKKINTSPQKNQEGIDKKVKDTNLNITDIKKENKKERKQADRPDPLTDEELQAMFVNWLKGLDGDAWYRESRNAVYLALCRFYAPRDSKKQEPARSAAGFTSLSGRLARLSNGDPWAMVEMLDISTTSLWKSVFPLSGSAAKPVSPSAKEDEEWLN